MHNPGGGREGEGGGRGREGGRGGGGGRGKEGEGGRDIKENVYSVAVHTLSLYTST